jgi:hypothetical protein
VALFTKCRDGQEMWAPSFSCGVISSVPACCRSGSAECFLVWVLKFGRSSDRAWVGCVGAVLFSRGFQIWAARVFNSGQVLFANFFIFIL